MTNIEKLNSLSIHDIAKIMVRNYDDPDWDIYYISTPDGESICFRDDIYSNEDLPLEQEAFEEAVQHTMKWLDSEYSINEGNLFTKFNYLTK